MAIFRLQRRWLRKEARAVSRPPCSPPTVYSRGLSLVNCRGVRNSSGLNIAADRVDEWAAHLLGPGIWGIEGTGGTSGRLGTVDSHGCSVKLLGGGKSGTLDGGGPVPGSLLVRSLITMTTATAIPAVTTPIAAIRPMTNRAVFFFGACGPGGG